MWKMSRVLAPFFFFFQAEDGIRDSSVTGVQTCALPIYPVGATGGQALPPADAHGLQAVARVAAGHLAGERGEDAAAGGADRMAQRDAGPVEDRKSVV